ncbi:MAG: hypothetical protein EPN82_06650 [Bacteroidetes bacterium]|nr:MAG: hypothetical protein EPN82_06650 [Bacteroidota bacterium]
MAGWLLRNNRWLIVIFLILILFSTNLFSEEKKSDLSFSVGIGANLNIHTADFQSIPYSEIKWQGFKSGFGIGENIFAGIEYRFGKKLFGSEARGRLNLAYSNLSADLKRDELIGHVITGITYTNGISEHIVESTISAIMIEPELVLKPFSEKQISTSFGFQFGFPLKMKYMQEERLTNPDYGYYETGGRTREHYDSLIPFPSSLYFAISLGARYELYDFGNFSLLPEIRFNLGLTNLTGYRNWKANSISIGAVLQLNPSIKKSLPPPEPPPPVKPTPPQPEPPELTISVYNNEKELKSGDTIKVKVIDTLFVTSYFVSPIIFFKENEYEIDEKRENPNTQEEAQRIMLEAVKKYMSENPDVGITLISSSLDNENNEIVTRRNENIVDKLKIDKKKIKQVRIIKKNKFKYAELADENRFVRFQTGENKQGFILHGDTIVKSLFNNVEIEVEPKIKSEEEYSFEGQIKNSYGNKIELNESKRNYILNELISGDSLGNGIKLSVIAKVKDKSSQEAIAELELNLKKEDDKKVIIENSVNKDGSNFTEYILGFCNFGKPDFYSINKKAVEYVNSAVQSGKKIEILPLTDSLGSADYNITLANKRAEAALKILKINKDNINITVPDKYIFSNSTPEGRLLNRSVLVRVY